MTINKVFISGNLTKDAVQRVTASGFPLCEFGIAVNDRRKNAAGEYENYANFIDCTLLGSRSEKLAPMLKKGLKVTIEGKLHYSSWQDKNTGATRSKVDVTVDNIELPYREQPAQQQMNMQPTVPANQMQPTAPVDQMQPAAPVTDGGVVYY